MQNICRKLNQYAPIQKVVTFTGKKCKTTWKWMINYLQHCWVQESVTESVGSQLSLYFAIIFVCLHVCRQGQHLKCAIKKDTKFSEVWLLAASTIMTESIVILAQSAVYQSRFYPLLPAEAAPDHGLRQPRPRQHLSRLTYLSSLGGRSLGQ